MDYSKAHKVYVVIMIAWFVVPAVMFFYGYWMASIAWLGGGFFFPTVVEKPEVSFINELKELEKAIKK